MGVALQKLLPGHERLCRELARIEPRTRAVEARTVAAAMRRGDRAPVELLAVDQATSLQHVEHELRRVACAARLGLRIVAALRRSLRRKPGPAEAKQRAARGWPLQAHTLEDRPRRRALRFPQE